MLLLLGSLMSLSLTGCKSNEENVAVVESETVDKFAVDDNINVNGNVDNSTNNGSISESNQGSGTSNTGESVEDGFEPASNEWKEIEENNIKLDESLAEESKAEEESFVNSNERMEVYMTYDRTEGDDLIAYVMDGETKMEYTVKVSSVTEGIDSCSQGDEICIVSNGAFINDTEFAKAYKVVNVTAEQESIVASEQAAEALDVESENE